MCRVCTIKLILKKKMQHTGNRVENISKPKTHCFLSTYKIYINFEILRPQ